MNILDYSIHQDEKLSIYFILSEEEIIGIKILDDGTYKLSKKNMSDEDDIQLVDKKDIEFCLSRIVDNELEKILKKIIDDYNEFNVFDI